MLYLRYLLLSFLLLSENMVQGQVYSDYVGAGHAQGVTVTSSSNSNQTEVHSSVNGSGLKVDAYGMN